MVKKTFYTFVAGLIGAVMLAGTASAQMLPINCPTTNERTWPDTLPNGNSSRVATFGVDECWCSENDPSGAFNNLTRRIVNPSRSQQNEPFNIRAAQAIYDNGGFTSDGANLHPDIAPFFTSLQKGMRFTVNPADNSTKTETRYCITTAGFAGFFSALQNFAQNWRGQFNR